MSCRDSCIVPGLSGYRPWRGRGSGLSRYPRDDQHYDQDERASSNPRYQNPRQDNPSQRQSPRQPSRTRQIDDEPYANNEYPRSRGSGSRDRRPDDRERGMAPRPNTQLGGSDRRASRQPPRDGARSSSRRDDQGIGGVAAWDDARTRHNWDDSSDQRDNGPRGWDDKRWRSDDGRDGGQSRRSSTRNRQRSGAAYDDDGRGGWAGDSRRGSSRSQYRERDLGPEDVRLGGLAGWWENSRQWVAQRGQRGQRGQQSQHGRHDQRSPQTSARSAKKAGLFGLSRRATTLVVVAVILACTLASGLTPFL